MEKSEGFHTTEDEVANIYCDECNKFIDINCLCEHYEEQSLSEQVYETETNQNTDLTHPVYSKNTHNQVLSNDGNENLETFEEMLIADIQAHSVLWDPSMKIQEKTKAAKDSAWRDIYNNFNGKYSLETLQKKWKNLKDTFIRVKGDLEQYVASGSETKKRKKVWKHYENMKFLNDQQNKKNRFTNVSSKILNKEDFPGSSNSDDTPSVTPTGRPGKKDLIGEAILEAIRKVPPLPVAKNPEKLNPICIRISGMLEHLSGEKKVKAEIALLNKAYELIYKETY